MPAKLALSFVMAALVAVIHVFLSEVRKTWTPGTRLGVMAFAEV